MFKRFLLAVVALCVVGVAVVLALREDSVATDDHGRRARFAELAPEVLDLRAEQDVVRLKRVVGQVLRLQQRIDAASALFDRSEERALSADERAEAMAIFEAVIDQTIALDSIARFHLDFLQLSILDDKARHARHFALFFASYVEKLALGLALIDRTLNKPQFEKLFDEGNQAFGIAPGAYKTLKWNVVHVEDASTTLAAHQWLKVLHDQVEEIARGDPRGWGFVLNRLEDRYALVKGNLVRKSVKLFGGNALDLGKDATHKVWFPVQAEAAEVMGDTRVRRHVALITEAQALDVVPKTAPGDILVERRNWYLSNVGLPGFWPHAALYLGSADELAKFFADDDVTRAYGKPLVEVLEERHPAAWASYVARDAEGHLPRVIEAMSEGVVFTSVEHSIGTADYVASLVPMVSKLDRARAIDRAFSFAGRPYDFDFDFFTDSSLVCSELVYKAYEPRAETAGLRLPLERVVGRMTLGPNTIVRLFDAEYGTPAQQLEFGWFLDARERDRLAFFSDVNALRRSHLRPKWDVMQK